MINWYWISSMRRYFGVLQDALLFAAISLQVLVSPFAKVEESFNLQALYDLHTLPPLAAFDHQTFPGVVPRSFLGAIGLSLLATPLRLLEWLIRMVIRKNEKQPGTLLHIQFMYRLLLGLLTTLCLSRLRRAISKTFSERVALMFTVLLVLTQFHLLFYSSRTLPNTFSLCLSSLAFAAWLQVSALILDKNFFLFNNRL